MNPITKNEAIRDLYNIHKSSEELLIQYLPNNSLLSVSVLSGKVYQMDEKIFKQKVLYSTIKAKAILGIIKILNKEFLLYVKSCESICYIDSYVIYRIKEVDMIPIMPQSLISSLSNTDTMYLIDGIKNLMQLGFYYSFGYDLTSTRQKQSKFQYRNTNFLNNLNNNMNINNYKNMGYYNSYNMMNFLETVDTNYFFNFNLYKKFYTNENKPINPYFITPIICGYVNCFEEQIKNKFIKFIIISRRSRHHMGTRYNTRGIDDNGNCANFVETEQIIKCENNVLSFSQLRGSAPIFFQQTGMTAQTQITRNTDLSMKAYNKHFDKIFKDYPMIYCINLLNKNKENEDKVTKQFEDLIKKNYKKTLRYYFFDMQNECKNDNYDRVDYLIQQVDVVLNIFQFYCENESTHEVLKNQNGTIRINCLDCLDRTNVIQTRISWNILGKMLMYLNINISDLFNPKIPFFTSTDSQFRDTFKSIWCDNGDAISIQYAGTASTITTVTKTGGHNLYGLISHGIATVSRFYQGSFEDDFKQQCYDLLIQKNMNQDYLSPFIENELLKYEAEFKQYKDVLIYIGTWNVNGKIISNLSSLFQWLLPTETLAKNNIRPDIYIIGFQEIVDLNPKNIMIGSNNANTINQWKEFINSALKSISISNDPYMLVNEMDLVGIYLVMFAKKSLFPSITYVDTFTVKSGLMGNTGNKGTCALRINIDDSSLAVACNHLTQGKDNSETRRNEILNIVNKPFEKYPNTLFRNYDYYFFFGDLNSRCILDIPKSLEFIKQNDIEGLLQYDQLNIFKKETALISDFDEAIIKFKPTYKYSKISNEYDTLKRTPSYCDRICYKKGSKLNAIYYDRCENCMSDHKPVYGLYNISVVKIDKNKKTSIINQIKKDFEASKNNHDVNYKNTSITNNIQDNFFKVNTNNNNNNPIINPNINSSNNNYQNDNEKCDIYKLHNNLNNKI